MKEEKKTEEVKDVDGSPDDAQPNFFVRGCNSVRQAEISFTNALMESDTGWKKYLIWFFASLAMGGSGYFAGRMIWRTKSVYHMQNQFTAVAEEALQPITVPG